MEGHGEISQWNRRKAGCLYCGRPGPYSDEHVVTAGLGGDDRAWMLKDCVCRICNSGVFSKQETKLLKQSPAALARLFLQPTTRDRKTPPSIDTESTLLLSPGGTWAVAELRAGGEPVSVPQVTLHFTDVEEHFAVGAPTWDALAGLENAVRDLLGSEFPLIVKHDTKRFGIIPLTWTGNSYEPGEEQSATSPPTRGIWLRPPIKPSQGPADAVVPWHLYMRSAGQMVCLCPDSHLAAAFLGRLRTELRSVFPRDSVLPEPTVIEHPQMFFRTKFDLHSFRRVQTKIGLNLLAHLIGQKFMRQAIFDQAVGYVLSKNDWGVRSGQMPEFALGPPLGNNHVFMLTAQRQKKLGPWHVSLISQLYGGLPMILQLGWSPTRPDALRESIVVQVDYTTHTIRKRTLEDHAADLIYQRRRSSQS